MFCSLQLVFWSARKESHVSVPEFLPLLPVAFANTIFAPFQFELKAGCNFFGSLYNLDILSEFSLLARG